MQAPTPGHVVVPIDKTQQASLQVVDHLLKQVYLPGDTIHLLHCVAPDKFDKIGLHKALADNLQEARVQLAAKSLEYISETHKELLAKLDAHKVAYKIEIARSSTDVDAVGKLVCQRAAELGARMIVMAKHDKGAIKEFFVGSCTNFCAAHSSVPILVLHCDC